MSTDLVTVTNDDLLAILPESADGTLYDGYSDAVTPDKIKLPKLIFNRTGVAKSGARFTPDQFFNTVAETVHDHVDCILSHVRASRAWTKYDDAEEKNVYLCSSRDGVWGTLEATQEKRACKGCPDAMWRTGANGKRTVNCSEVYSVLARDLATGEPFTVKFAKTSTPAFIAHLTKYHANKLRVAGRIQNVPLFAFHVRLSLALQPNGKYALPVITVTARSTREEAQASLDAAEAMRDLFADVAAERDVDTSFNPDEFSK